ncbi:VOC family protein [Marinicella sp. W31]|uniref:VOC family protein n=1 Tax=Marinicella sp. W31 TaxID=3023713 RepID=UPI00375834BF
MKNFYISVTLLIFSCVTVAAEKAVKGLDHLGLSVSDLSASETFFTKALGFSVAGRDADYPAAFLSNGDIFITLWQTKAESTVPFNRKNNVGLHHLALQVSSLEKLHGLHQSLENYEGVKIEFAPELSYGGPAMHMMLREPSGNRIELIHRPKK